MGAHGLSKALIICAVEGRRRPTNYGIALGHRREELRRGEHLLGRRQQVVHLLDGNQAALVEAKLASVHELADRGDAQAKHLGCLRHVDLDRARVPRLVKIQCSMDDSNHVGFRHRTGVRFVMGARQQSARRITLYRHRSFEFASHDCSLMVTN